ncbi:MAG TPA: bifunctional hydroxymethylpyrimidine kinase/phosphomethylpyrimidine kinase [Vicinamibacterales bacterium]|nr:bifunctional hydroxymethylpyrimidine kinase/phosphomethylpyrimidine kinase [Vicinamibacterales bacterium]
MRTALTIAGSDPSGGAGVQADLKTFAAFGLYGACAITAVTVQSTKGVEAVAPLAADLVTAQIEAVAGDLTIAATKIGMLATAAIVEAVAAAIEELDLPLVVVDPVLVSSSGERLLDADGVAALRHLLLPLARVVTPNIPEAEALSGIRIVSPDTMRDAARRIHDMGARAVIITGGHAPQNLNPWNPEPQNPQPSNPEPGNQEPGNREPENREPPNPEPRTPNSVVDLLFDGRAFHEQRVTRIDSRHTHGTGCTYASAVAASLALGRDLAEAAARAQQYVAGAIAHAPGLGGGRGPLDHFWAGIMKT